MSVRTSNGGISSGSKESLEEGSVDEEDDDDDEDGAIRCDGIASY